MRFRKTQIYLELQSNQITHISGMSALTNLKVLLIKSNPIQDVTPLRTHLESNPKMTIDVGFIGKSPCPLMYWIDMEKGTLHGRLGDTAVHLCPYLQNATSLALRDSDCYWTEKTDDKNWWIQHAKRYGGITVDADIDDGVHGTGIPMDMTIRENHLYVSVASGKIQRLRVDGSDFEPDFITGLISPGSIDVDVGGGKVYWTEKEDIWRASLNGENVERVITDLGVPAHLVLDVR